MVDLFSLCGVKEDSTAGSQLSVMVRDVGGPIVCSQPCINLAHICTIRVHSWEPWKDGTDGVSQTDAITMRCELEGI